MPTKIKSSLETGKLINNEWDNKDKLSLLINDCIKIENNILDINSLNEVINRCNSINIEIKFNPEEYEINNFIIKIEDFGSVKSINKNKVEEKKIIIQKIIKKNEKLKKELNKKLTKKMNLLK